MFVASGYLLIVAPVLDLYGSRQAMLEDRRMLAPRLQAAAAELPALRARLAELRTAATTTRFTLDGATDAIASANLQSRIEELAGTVGVTIGSTESLPAENRGGYRRIGLRLATNGSYETLLKLLAGIEKSNPPLVLSNLQLRAAMRPNGDTANPRLDAGFEVYGFRNAETTPGGKP